MDGFFAALSQHGFLQAAVVAALLASVGCGVMGTYVVVKRIAFIAGGIAHSVLGGMGAAVYFGFDPLLGALIAAIFAALLIGWIRLHWRVQEDTLIGAIWATGMAAGLLFIAKTPGYQADLMSFLFGNILLVPRESLWFMVAYHRQFLAVVFDEEFARLRGIPVDFFYLLLLVLVAVTVVLLIQVVGLILVLALLTLPAAVAGHYVHSLTRMMVIATLLGMALSVAGLAVSYGPDLPAGPTIVLLAGAVYVLSAVFTQLAARQRARLAVAVQAPPGGPRE
jgi:zinc transport system permease protein